MRQEVRFCHAADGTRLAYATLGQGPPLVKAAHWLTHLEHEIRRPAWLHWLHELSRDHTLVRYDERGCGLSDWEVDAFGVEVWVRDLEAVVDTLGLERFPLLGVSQGGPVAAAYAARHPERVSHLIIYGSYARGALIRPGAAPAQHNALTTLIELGWGQANPAYRRVFANLFMPQATEEQLTWFEELERVSTSPRNAARFHDAFGRVDVTGILPRVRAPTLVLHASGDARVPAEGGREFAALIPGARFVLLEGRNHLLLEDEPAWQQFLADVRGFLGVVRSGPAPGPAPAGPVRPGARLGPYELTGRLGRGGMGEVFQARDIRLGRLVALKVLDAPALLAEAARQRFLVEARAASALDHPNICTVHDVGETPDGLPYLVTALYRGETLDRKIARGPLPVPAACDYAARIADGLGFAHEAGIVHRDVKPSNVMITDRNEVKLLDFGVAKVGDTGLTNTGVLVGTAAYASPEQAGGQPVDGRSDLWSLGVVLYEMLVGQLPFQGEGILPLLHAILQAPAPALEAHRPDAPPALAATVDRLLRKDPGDRYPAAAEVARALRAVVAG